MLTFHTPITCSYSNTNAQSSNLLVISPRLEAVIEDGGTGLVLGAQVDDGNWSATSVDDYTDWRFNADATLQINSRNLITLGAGIFNTRERRGTGFSQGGFAASVPDEYEETDFGGSYQLGAQGSGGRLVLGMDAYDKSYDNNRTTTRFREREDTNWNAGFFWAVSPRTDVFIEYQASDVDYVNDPTAVIGAADSLDSDEKYTYVGASWEATASTTGSVKIGNGKKEFSDIDRLDASATSWELNIDWTPLTYSTVNLSAYQGYDEATGVGNALETSRYGLNWMHNWSNALSSSIGLNASDDKYIGSSRTDDVKNLNLQLNYAFERWLDFYVSYTYSDKESNFTVFSYEENVFAIGLSASL